MRLVDFTVAAGCGHSGANQAAMSGQGKINRGGDMTGADMNDRAFWRFAQIEVWEYRLGGYQVLKVLFSYRQSKLLAERRHGSEVEAALGRFAHASAHLLGQVLRVELVDALDDRFHQLAGRRVVSVLGDRGDPDSAPAQHRLEGDGVFAFAGEAGELPDQDLLERLVRHLRELRPVGDAARLGFVDVFPGQHVAIALGVVAQRA